MNKKYEPKQYMRTDNDILEHIYNIVENLDGAGLVITDPKEVERKLFNMSGFVCEPLRGGLDDEDDELE